MNTPALNNNPFALEPDYFPTDNAPVLNTDYVGNTDTVGGLSGGINPYIDDVYAIKTTTPNTKKMHKGKQLQYITRKATTGEKSVLWISKRGNYYATVIDAKKDKASRAIAYHPATGRIIMPPPPTPAVTPPTTTTPATSKKQNVAFMAVVGTFIALLIYKIFK